MWLWKWIQKLIEPNSDAKRLEAHANMKRPKLHRSMRKYQLHSDSEIVRVWLNILVFVSFDCPVVGLENNVHIRSIPSENKGFKMLSKLGWSEGQTLGKNNDGLLEPVITIQIENRNVKQFRLIFSLSGFLHRKSHRYHWNRMTNIKGLAVKVAAVSLASVFTPNRIQS